VPRPGLALLPLRLFLGVTFTFAGLQKLADPRFFDSRSPASIQAQLQAAAARSPIGGILSTLEHHAVAVGVCIALAELAVGVGTLLGLYTRAAAIGGMVLAVGFLLSVSWHSSPYYLGADVVYLFAWTPLALGGAGGVFAIDTLLEQRPSPTGEQIGRRTVLTRGAAAAVAGGVALLSAGITAALGRAAGGGRRPLLVQPAPPRSTAPPTTVRSAAPLNTSATTTTTPAGAALGPATAVPVGGGKLLEDPTRFQPLWVLQPQARQFVAVSAVCTHRGCTVGYSPSSRTFLCPCHGARFATDGEVLAGPAGFPLATQSVREGPDGLLYLA